MARGALHAAVVPAEGFESVSSHDPAFDRIARIVRREPHVPDLEMLKKLPARKRRRTVGADEGYDTRGFVREARALNRARRCGRSSTARLS